MRRKRREVVVVKIYRYSIYSKIPKFQAFLEGLGIEVFALANTNSSHLCVLFCCIQKSGVMRCTSWARQDGTEFL
jgi:hypothetical protein